MRSIIFPVRLHKRGFALVVTLSLMILLTVVAVGLLTLSSISLRSSTATSAMSEARSNARMALMMAVGELQKQAGQDQRTTATADIAGMADGSLLAAGAQPATDTTVNGEAKGLSPVQPGTRYWTGVFANTEKAEEVSKSIFTKTPNPKIVQWLVSGSDSSYPASGPTLTPADANCVVGSNGEVADGTKAVVLVGENTVGLGPGGVDRHVAVPVLKVLDRTASKPAGRYAWWVGDEGVKASIHIGNKLSDPKHYASLTAQRRGWEAIDGMKDYPTPSSPLHGSLSKVISLAQAELLVPGIGTQTGGTSPLQSIFHSATPHSSAVLADTLNGGTKIDLTAILADALPASNPLPPGFNYPVKGKNIIPSTASTSMRAPRWDAVKQFYDRYNALQSGALAASAAATDYESAIAPLVTDFRILMGARIKAVNAAAGTFNVSPCGKVAISIANPYSVPLKWSNDLEFEIRNLTPPNNSPARIWGNINPKPAYIPNSTSEAAVFQNAVFRIRASTLAPGEARAFTVGSYVKRPAGSAARVVIDLAPFASSSPFNFNNCVELENLTVYEPDKLSNARFELDVRESWQTTLVMLEMRLSGSSRILRQIERFELDNGYFSPNQRRFTKAEALLMTLPFPLMLYSFQISQPGTAYKELNLMPANYDMGQRASTIRTFADFNLQATRVRRPIASYNPPPYFVESNNSWGQLSANPPGGDTGSGFTRGLALTPLPWGRSATGSQKTVLFTVPAQFSSLAELQHADLTGDDRTSSIGHQPGNAVGNSYATPFVKRMFTSQTRWDYMLQGAPDHLETNPTEVKYYDLCYLLNASLWDSYYFSMIPRTGTSIPENPSLIRLDGSASADLKDPVKAASLLMVDGAFNVNSTDKNAWKAFLASARQFKHNADSTANPDAAFPRSLEQLSSSAAEPTGHEADSFSGFRRLSDSQLDALAQEIVKQVRLRGPFVSVSHFVNRALAAIDKQPALTRSGALQAAIDESGANINFAGTKNVFKNPDLNGTTDLVTLRGFEGAPRADFDGGDRGERPASAGPDPDWATTSTDNNFGAVASIIADREMLLTDSYKREQGYRSTGIPGWLTQADVLQVIGPSITARSDTFRIRAFGESLDAGGKSIAKAYCEAIVQRVPGYVDAANIPSDRDDLSTGKKVLSDLNKTYGRQFQIVSFRWLSPSEI